MTHSKKHHFLPVFYLKAWSSRPNRIHLYDIKAGTTRQHIGLKGQGQERLYYKDQHNEDVLKAWDTRFARVCRQVKTSQRLPNPLVDPVSFVDLFAFVVTQHARVPSKAEELRQIYVQSIPIIMDAMGAPPGDTCVKYDFPQLEAVNLAAKGQLVFMDDLVPHLITARDDRFLTSDNPAFFYNQLCQGLYGATTGVDAHGFQAFCPISPRIVVMLFDPGAYELTSTAAKAEKRSEATESDIRQLNRMQVLSAAQNLYANTPDLLEDVPAIIRTVAAERETKEPQLAEYQSTKHGDQSALLVVHNVMPNLSLDLSFTRTRWSADKRPDWWKVHDYRHGPNRIPQLLREGSPIEIFVDPNEPTAPVIHMVSETDFPQWM